MYIICYVILSKSMNLYNNCVCHVEKAQNSWLGLHLHILSAKYTTILYQRLVVQPSSHGVLFLLI